MAKFEDFRVLQLKSLQDPKTACHVLYIKDHSVRTKAIDKPEGRTLFVLNVPPYIDLVQLKNMFSVVGEISNISIGHPSPDDIIATSFSSRPKFKFSFAHISYQKTESLKMILNLNELIINFNECFSGVSKWELDFKSNYPRRYEFQKEIDEYIAKNDLQEEKERALQKQILADAEGWMTVPKRGANAGFEQKESIVHNLEKKMENGKKKKELLNFYTFQIRESKMKHIVSLRDKFEQDKKKIETMKRTRRFKPF